MPYLSTPSTVSPDVSPTGIASLHLTAVAAPAHCLYGANQDGLVPAAMYCGWLAGGSTSHVELFGSALLDRQEYWQI